MILIYAIGVVLLGLASLLTARRARSVEKKYVHIAKAADQLAKELNVREGNSNKITDTLSLARKNYELGCVVSRRDRLETKYDKWVARTDWFNRLRTRIVNWKGRLVPYMLGVIDVAIVGLGLIAFKVLDVSEMRIWIDNLRNSLNL
jgi:hypothetical protein